MSRFYNISTDNTLGGVSPSDAIVSSQKAIKEYVDDHSGAVDSVNGKTGVVVLTATDVGALPDSTVIPDPQIQSDWNQADNTKVDFIKNKPTIPVDISAHRVNGVPLSNSASVFYGVSTSAKTVVDKIVSIPSITTLDVGTAILVKPTVTSTVADSGIKLNDFPAYPMRYGSSAITTSTDSIVWAANTPSWWVFDGEYWIFAGHGIDNNSTYSAMSVAEGITGTATNSRAMTAANTKQIIQGTTLTDIDVATTGAVSDADSITSGIGKLQATKADKTEIPTVNNPTITITQGGVTKGSITLNQASDDTIALDAGGGGSTAIDNITITKNLSDEIQTVATVNANTSSGATATIYDWVGTLDQYTSQAVATNHPEWICYITDDISGGTSVYTKTETENKIVEYNHKQITNCITNIPQDIKLELDNGTLTLKAGSKVYVPNGAVYDMVTIANDITFTMTWGANSKRLFFVRPNGNNWVLDEREVSFSGGTAPTSDQYSLWYDTTNNLIKMTSDYGSTWTSGLSFPIALITNTNNVTTSIDQVFNGFGYIGSTVFVLPGVEGLIPNGFNDDGSLKNTAFKVTSVISETDPNNYTNHMFVGTDGSTVSRFGSLSCIYNQYTNKNENAGSVVNQCIFANVYRINSKVETLNSIAVFHAVDYSDTEFITHQAMPSGRYISLTLGASGNTYTAPADGYFYLRKTGTSLNQYAMISGGGIAQDVFNPISGTGTRSVWLPVKKGTIVTISYNMDGTTNAFRFVYAEGSK